MFLSKNAETSRQQLIQFHSLIRTSITDFEWCNAFSHSTSQDEKNKNRSHALALLKEKEISNLSTYMSNQWTGAVRGPRPLLDQCRWPASRGVRRAGGRSVSVTSGVGSWWTAAQVCYITRSKVQLGTARASKITAVWINIDPAQRTSGQRF